MNALSVHRSDSNTDILIRAIALVLCMVLCCSMFMLSEGTVAFCADENAAEDIGSAVETISGNAYGLMRSIVIPILIVVIGIAGFYMVFGGNNGTEKARKTLIGALGFLILVIFAPVIGKTMGDMFAGNGAADFGSYNPLK